MIVTLPWPPRHLSPNVPTHWAAKAKAAKAYRDACWALVKEAKPPSFPGDGVILLCLEFVEPDKRKRDMDNMLAACKHGLDGVALALNVNDHRFAFQLTRSEQIGGMVKITIQTP